jgi:hypothetical protein
MSSHQKRILSYRKQAMCSWLQNSVVADIVVDDRLTLVFLIREVREVGCPEGFRGLP